MRGTERKADMAFFVSFATSRFFLPAGRTDQQLRYLDGQLPAYRGSAWAGRTAPTKGSSPPVYFDTSRFTLVRQRHIWLSDTPDTVSIGWDAALPRVCTYALFRDKTSGKLVHLFNHALRSHGRRRPGKSAILILDRIAEWTTDEERVILTAT